METQDLLRFHPQQSGKGRRMLLRSWAACCCRSCHMSSHSRIGPNCGRTRRRTCGKGDRRREFLRHSVGIGPSALTQGRLPNLWRNSRGNFVLGSWHCRGRSSCTVERVRQTSLQNASSSLCGQKVATNSNGKGKIDIWYKVLLVPTSRRLPGVGGPWGVDDSRELQGWNSKCTTALDSIVHLN
jgi:hypothetical protein